MKAIKACSIFMTVFLFASFTPSADAVESVPSNLANLKEGNQRFINNAPIHEKISAEERKEFAQTQTPFATIVACSDSRVAPELIFDQRPGDLFIVRLAGNTVDQFALASIEYGVSYLRTPLLIVMGHENCGAVKAAFELQNQTFSPKITALLEKIEPAVTKAKEQNPDKSNDELLKVAIENNVKLTTQTILESIPDLASQAKEGKLTIKEAIFKINNGEVVWID